jgi:hypothetical protein
MDLTERFLIPQAPLFAAMGAPEILLILCPVCRWIPICERVFRAVGTQPEQADDNAREEDGPRASILFCKTNPRRCPASGRACRVCSHPGYRPRPAGQPGERRRSPENQRCVQTALPEVSRGRRKGCRCSPRFPRYPGLHQWPVAGTAERCTTAGQHPRRGGDRDAGFPREDHQGAGSRAGG